MTAEHTVAQHITRLIEQGRLDHELDTLMLTIGKRLVAIYERDRVEEK